MAAASAAGQVELAFESDGPSSYTLPGKGDQPKSCGQWYPGEFCNHCGEPRFTASRCMNRSCPECWSLWSRDRAEAITLRLAAARHVGLWNKTELHRCPDVGKRGHRVEECSECGRRPVEPVSEAHTKRAIHATVSAPEGAVETVEDVHEAFGEVYDLAREHGLRGGVVVFHAYRLADWAKVEWREQRQSGETELKKWAWVREQEGDWREFVKWSPHWHILGLADDFKAADDESTDGWVVRNIRSLDRFDIDHADGYRDMYYAARYLLSHTAIEIDESTDSVRWYGELHPVNFNPDPTDLERKQRSPLEVEEWREIEAQVARLTGREPEEEGDQEEPCEVCDESDYSPIYLAREALQRPEWCQSIGGEQQYRLLTAWEWMIGEIKPPPGLQNPTSKEEALETFEALLEGGRR